MTWRCRACQVGVTRKQQNLSKKARDTCCCYASTCCAVVLRTTAARVCVHASLCDARASLTHGSSCLRACIRAFLSYAPLLLPASAVLSAVRFAMDRANLFGALHAVYACSAAERYAGPEITLPLSASALFCLQCALQWIARAWSVPTVPLTAEPSM
jgi:hypothetical protein